MDLELERCIVCNSILTDNNVKVCEICKVKYCIFCNGKGKENPDLCKVCKIDLLNDMFSNKNK